MNDTQIDALLVALSSEGFDLAYRANVRDYLLPDRTYESDAPEWAALKAADIEAWQLNRDALRRALSTITADA